MINLKTYLFFVTECSGGFFGPNCSQKCENCKQQSCYITNGTCLSGCLKDFEGEMCNKKASAYTEQHY